MTNDEAYSLLHDHHCSVAEVAAYGAITPRYVKILAARHIKTERRLPIPKKTTGTTWQEVAKELGCSRATAFRRLAGRSGNSRSTV